MSQITQLSTFFHKKDRILNPLIRLCSTTQTEVYCTFLSKLVNNVEFVYLWIFYKRCQLRQKYKFTETESFQELCLLSHQMWWITLTNSICGKEKVPISSIFLQRTLSLNFIPFTRWTIFSNLFMVLIARKWVKLANTQMKGLIKLSMTLSTRFHSILLKCTLNKGNKYTF